MKKSLQEIARLEAAADAVANLSDAVEALGEMLDAAYNAVGPEIYGEITKAFPLEDQFGPGANKELARLYRSLVPPDVDREEAA